MHNAHIAWQYFSDDKQLSLFRFSFTKELIFKPIFNRTRKYLFVIWRIRIPCCWTDLVDCTDEFFKPYLDHLDADAVLKHFLTVNFFINIISIFMNNFTIDIFRYQNNLKLSSLLSWYKLKHYHNCDITLCRFFMIMKKYANSYLQENNTELTNTASNDHSDDKINICNIDRTTNIITG